MYCFAFPDNRNVFDVFASIPKKVQNCFVCRGNADGKYTASLLHGKENCENAQSTKDNGGDTEEKYIFNCAESLRVVSIFYPFCMYYLCRSASDYYFHRNHIAIVVVVVSIKHHQHACQSHMAECIAYHSLVDG